MGKWGDRLEAGGGKDGVEVAELGGRRGRGVCFLNIGLGFGPERKKKENGLRGCWVYLFDLGLIVIGSGLV